MTESLDVYAMTNPALCAVVLAAFARGYKKGADDWPRMPVMFLPIPIVLSSRVAKTFKGTNRSTGLLEWLSRAPHVGPIVGNRVRLTESLSRRGLLFGLRYHLLRMDGDGQIIVEARADKRLRRRDVPKTLASHLRAATRLGIWVGELRSPATVFHSFGVTP